MKPIRLTLSELPPDVEGLRREVREFLDRELADFPPEQRAYTWMGADPEFSRKVGAQGWIGMTWPKRYGGGERSALERYVVIEEMLVAGAPVGAHWITDRQTGPMFLNYGTEEQRQHFLPGICRGEIFFCIGMSEPDSGSDLASIRSRARKEGDGWVLNGTKVWTSGAHASHYMMGLFRTQGDVENKHDGLSQFVVDLRETKGIEVRTIRDLAGNEHFCEVAFEDAFVPAEALVGEEGRGWQQVMAELAYERSGPERYLSCYPLFRELLRTVRKGADDRTTAAIGTEVARLATLRTMSVSVAGMLEQGEKPALEASIVKDLGALFEQALPGLAQSLVDQEPRTDGGTDYQKVLGVLMQNAPAFSLRGGTREILRGIIARGLGLR